MPDEPDPPRKFYGFKPKEFENVNGVPPAVPEGAPPNPANLGPTPDSGRITVRDLFNQAQMGGPLLAKDPPPAGPKNDVHAMLAENLARADALGLNDVAPPKYGHHRRRRDYIVLVITGNLFFAVIYAVEMFIGFQVQCLAARMPNEFGNLVRFALTHPASYAMGLVGMVFYTGALTWLMYGVMDDY